MTNYIHIQHDDWKWNYDLLLFLWAFNSVLATDTCDFYQAVFSDQEQLDMASQTSIGWYHFGCWSSEWMHIQAWYIKTEQPDYCKFSGPTWAAVKIHKHIWCALSTPFGFSETHPSMVWRSRKVKTHATPRYSLSSIVCMPTTSNWPLLHISCYAGNGATCNLPQSPCSTPLKLGSA